MALCFSGDLWGFKMNYQEISENEAREIFAMQTRAVYCKQLTGKFFSKIIAFGTQNVKAVVPHAGSNGCGLYDTHRVQYFLRFKGVQK